METEYADLLQDIKNMIPKYFLLYFAVFKERISDAGHRGIITYGILREIFWPDDIVISFKSSEPRAYRVLSAQYKRAEFMSPAHLQIKVEYVDFDGSSLGTVKDTLKIDEFEDVVYLKDLSVCPLQYISDKETMLETLRNRGKKFLDLRGQSFKFYDGLVTSLRRYRDEESYVRPIFFLLFGKLDIELIILFFLGTISRNGGCFDAQGIRFIVQDRGHSVKVRERGIESLHRKLASLHRCDPHFLFQKQNMLLGPLESDFRDYVQ